MWFKVFHAPFSVSCAILVAFALLPLGCGGGGSASTNNTPAPSAPTAVSISPTSPTVFLGQQQQFTATVSNGNGNSAVTWNVNGAQGGNSAYGTVTASGLYTSPSTPPTGTITVQAVWTGDSSKSASASVSVTTMAAVSKPLITDVFLSPRIKYTVNATPPSLSVHGANFVSNATVSIGGQQVKAQYVSSSEIDIPTPPTLTVAGYTPLIVTNPGTPSLSGAINLPVDATATYSGAGQALAFFPDDSRQLVLAAAGDTLGFLILPTTAYTTISMPNNVDDVAIDDTAGRAYVAVGGNLTDSFQPGGIVTVDLASQQILRSTAFPYQWYSASIWLDTASNALLVNSGNSLARYDTQTGTFTMLNNSLPISGGGFVRNSASPILVDSGKGLAYINLQGQITRELSMQGISGSVVLNNEGTIAYAVTDGPGEVDAYNLSDGSEAARLPVGPRLSGGIGISASNDYLAVSGDEDSDDNYVVTRVDLINMSNATILGGVPCGASYGAVTLSGTKLICGSSQIDLAKDLYLPIAANPSPYSVTKTSGNGQVILDGMGISGSSGLTVDGISFPISPNGSAVTASLGPAVTYDSGYHTAYLAASTPSSIVPINVLPAPSLTNINLRAGDTGPTDNTTICMGGGFLGIPDYYNSQLLLYNSSTLTPVARISTGSQPSLCVIDPTLNLAAVIGDGSGIATVVDLATLKVYGKVDATQAQCYFVGAAFDPTKRRLYLGTAAADFCVKTFIIDLPTWSSLGEFPGAYGTLAVDSDNQKLLSYSSYLDIVTGTSSPTNAGTTAGQGNANLRQYGGWNFDSATHTAVMAHRYGKALFFNTATGKISMLNLGPDLAEGSCAGGGVAFFLNMRSDYATEVDISTETVKAFLPAPRFPISCAYDPTAKQLYVVGAYSKAVYSVQVN